MGLIKITVSFKILFLEFGLFIFLLLELTASFVLAQIPPDGLEFIVDPLLTLTIIIRMIVLVILGSFLIYKWLKSEKRFFTDFPFLMALSTFILVIAKAYDLYLYNFFGDSDFDLYFTVDPILIWYAKVRWLIMMINTIPMIALLLSIWMADYEKKYYYLILIVFISFWTIYFVIAPTFEYIKNIHLILLLPVIILSIVTYLFLYKYRRLPEIHSLIIAIAWIAYLISSLLRPLFYTIGEPPWGIIWVSEIMDLIIWSVMAMGFIIKPNYSKTAK